MKLKLPILREDGLGDVKIDDERLVPEPGTVDEGVQTFVLVGEGDLAKRLGMTAEGLRRCLWGTPLATVRVVAGIYWHAMQVWRKGNPYIKHPGTHQLQESVA